MVAPLIAPIDCEWVPVWQVDADHSGKIDFDEFVSMIRKLKPKNKARNSAEACSTAFLVLTNVKNGRPREVRQIVPVPRRAEAGAMLLTMRDLGYDDEAIISILLALYSHHAPEEPDGSVNSNVNNGGVVSHSIERNGGGGSGSGGGGGGGGGGHPLVPMRAAWTALGGGELVRLPANLFDFKTFKSSNVGKLGRRAEEHLATTELVASADRWMCAHGVDSAEHACAHHGALSWTPPSMHVLTTAPSLPHRCAHGVDSATFSDLLALLAEALYMPHGFSESVRALPRMLADCAADAR